MPNVYRIIYAVHERARLVRILHIRHAARSPLEPRSSRPHTGEPARPPEQLPGTGAGTLKRELAIDPDRAPGKPQRAKQQETRKETMTTSDMNRRTVLAVIDAAAAIPDAHAQQAPWSAGTAPVGIKAPPNATDAHHHISTCSAECATA